MISDWTRPGWDYQSPHAPEGRALDDDLDRPGELGVLGECFVDVDGLLGVTDADLGDGILGVDSLEEPRRGSCRRAEDARRCGVRLSG